MKSDIAVGETKLSNSSSSPSQSEVGIPGDDPQRRLTVANSDNPKLTHVAVAGDTYTILLRGADTAGHYCLIDMHVPAGGGPPLHPAQSYRLIPCHLRDNRRFSSA